MKDTILLHHSAINDETPQAQRIISSHLRNPKIRQAAAYHYLVERSGLKVQLHDENFIGYHAGNYKWNPRSIAVCIAGDLTRRPMTPEQEKSFAELMFDIQTRWGIPDSNILLHREVRLMPTACPGIDLRAVYFAKRAELRNDRVEQLKHAQKLAKGSRLTRITRILDRLTQTP